MKTHDYTQRYWGHDYAITGIHANNVIGLMGWGHGLFKGDFIRLQNGESETRYRLTEIDYLGDPRDMWRAKAKWAPRRNKP